MQKNLILALALSFLVYMFWFSWVEKRYAARPQTVPVAAQKPSAADKPGGTAQIPADTAEWNTRSLELAIPKGTVMLHPEGAGITSFLFNGPLGQVELVPSPKPGFFSTWPETVFRAAERTDNSAAFTARLPGGIVIRKTFTWDAGGGINTLEIKASNPSGKPAVLDSWGINLGPGLGTVKSEQSENAKLWKAAFAVEEEGKKHPVVKNLAKTKPAGKWLWAGMDNRYFLAAAIARQWEPVELEFSQTQVKDGKAPSMSLPHPKTILGPGETKTWMIDFYFGPKDYTRLLTLGHGLYRSVDFGFFSPLGKLANSALESLHKMTGNYGWAIVIMTVVLQILVFPLTWKSTKATFAMKKLQPQLQVIQQKYKNDPRRLNAEMMELYKKSGANPLGGCLPMLLQIPIFFALFTALRNSWGLHGAPFVFWIHDLSSKDPYYILPLVMGAVMFFQQQFNPQVGDPGQAAVMKWMPVLFTFMFINFPAGLVLYWLINSLLGFAQQLYMKGKMETA